MRPTASLHPYALAALGALVILAAGIGLNGKLLVPRAAAPEIPLPFVLCGGAGVVAGAEPMFAASGRPRPVPKIVSSEPLAHIPGKRVTVAIVDFPPRSLSPPHRHGGSVTAYVLSGTIRSQLGQGPVETFRPGGTFFEPLGIIHTLSENPSDTEPAQLMAIFVHDEGATLTTYLE
jgi:quercetin dioxygenase-like cupin family protein